MKNQHYGSYEFKSHRYLEMGRLDRLGDEKKKRIKTIYIWQMNEKKKVLKSEPLVSSPAGPAYLGYVL